jgi:hypothetical protein
MRPFLLCGLLLATLSFAVGSDLTTLKGTVYRNYTVTKAENGFLSISYEEGTANIKAEVLPEDVRTQYGLTSSDIPSAPVASQPSHLDELVLNDGTRYTNVKVVGVRADALSILYNDGGATIPFEKLSGPTCNRSKYRLKIPMRLRLRLIRRLPLTRNTLHPRQLRAGRFMSTVTTEKTARTFTAIIVVGSQGVLRCTEQSLRTVWLSILVTPKRP